MNPHCFANFDQMLTDYYTYCQQRRQDRGPSHFPGWNFYIFERGWRYCFLKRENNNVLWSQNTNRDPSSQGQLIRDQLTGRVVPVWRYVFQPSRARRFGDRGIQKTYDLGGGQAGESRCVNWQRPGIKERGLSKTHKTKRGRKGIILPPPKEGKDILWESLCMSFFFFFLFCSLLTLLFLLFLFSLSCKPSEGTYSLQYVFFVWSSVKVFSFLSTSVRVAVFAAWTCVWGEIFSIYFFHFFCETI